MQDALQSTHPYPADRSFVLKLHRDADLAGGEWRGRIVHLVSDERADFVGNLELLLTLEALIKSSVTGSPAAVAAPPIGTVEGAGASRSEPAART